MDVALLFLGEATYYVSQNFGRRTGTAFEQLYDKPFLIEGASFNHVVRKGFTINANNIQTELPFKRIWMLVQEEDEE